ncbi:hypothetical protein GCM10027037_00450 [Mucilaginibacter koreensis]
MKKITLYLLAGMTCWISACQKEFLDKKPNQALTVPTTLTDFQSLLDNNADINVAPYLSVTGTDDVYTTDAGLSGAGVVIANSYLWQPDIYQGQTQNDWNKPYQQVFTANVILDGLAKYQPNPASQSQFNMIKGSALFIRSLAFYHLAQQFAMPYDPGTASAILGIPVRLSSDVNQPSTRGTLQQVYDQITHDLLLAADLLPTQSDYKTRPTRQAAFALLARTYQTMQLYDQAGQYASACLNIRKDLIDYNTLTASLAKPLPRALPNGNDEVLYYTALSNVNFFIIPTLTSVDSALYRSYAANDLRKSIFFTVKSSAITQFKGNYSGTTAMFAGLALDEVYLIRAESYARAGNISAAMNDLNFLLQNRWKKGTFVPLTASSTEEALTQVLTERRKELVFRNTRWTDLKRLNQDNRFAKTLMRNANGKTYTLLPGSPRYAFPIPDDELRNSGIAQNNR